MPDSAFDRLEQHTKPAIVHRNEITGVMPVLLCAFPLFAFLGASRSAAPSALGPEVRVLATQRVAGYDAVVLEADSTSALTQWLKRNGYADRPELGAWLAPYVAARWKLTAFKIAPGKAATAIETAAVRMSFTTDRPFFPYREPADQRENRPATEQSRMLRVFFIGDAQVEGAIGAARSPWPGKAKWSDRLVLDGTPYPMPANPWLTMFEDEASPRPGTDDLFFTPNPDRTPVKPPPIIVKSPTTIYVPLDLLGLAVFGAFRLHRRMKRKGEASL